ncbi:hypothetical protein CXG81DRAFT_15107 [Caulochytrium protostelioides]|uniref:3-isopropylmalate dehydrogenase n=1 Tax=Caulochytrium protostelioides TaxID=1555241 RepID=A0A4V1IU22_9FUNG|nr:3-isopropylmalate dehydrogenase Leu2A [Caulochytrium protostelioides]RKO99047.1 hypothetical protein CXG81DRAFT_15107 [Caulochytrium protostelioides]|eukprot:RKO99047.1 hypothetical protein CXG81DRAFT_15107 [Caulochytrium protostelioides]
MVQNAHIVLLPGDGVGPEVTAAARRVLETVAKHRAGAVALTFSEELIGGCAIDATGDPLPDQTLAACRAAQAVLLGAVGGPKWDKAPRRPEQGLLKLRKELGLYANVRPCFFPAASLVDRSSLRAELVRDVNIVVVRELTGGVYFGRHDEEDASGKAVDEMVYTVPEVERITRVAASLAMLSTPPAPIISVDKANVLATSRLWRRVVTDVLAKEYPQIKLSHHLVDSCAMQVIRDPRTMNGILLTENMFGDILSDELSVIPGSLGLLPSASLSGWGRQALGVYEPIHGSAPDIAGMDKANPVGTILSAAMLLRYSLGMDAEAKLVEQAVAHVFDHQNIRTADLGGQATTTEFSRAVVAALEPLLA